MSKTILYARVSTADQKLDHQLAQAQRAGFEIDDVVSDHGTSGVSTKLAERPEGRRLVDMLREGDTLVVRWVDRLGRDYQDVTETVRAFMAKGVTIRTVINSLTFDGTPSDPMQKAVRDALIGFMAASAQAQAEATKEAQKAGIEAARANPQKYRGRAPSYDLEAFEQVLRLADAGEGNSAIARATGLSRQAIIRIRADPAKYREALERWAS